jgi:hypothetical protein
MPPLPGPPDGPNGPRAAEGGQPTVLRTPCFTATDLWNAGRIGALVVHCSDGRWRAAFDEFCDRRLFIPRYDHLAVPGGPVCLLPRDAGDAFCRGVWEQLDFLVRAHELRRVVLIAHYGCAYYAELLGKGPEECLPQQAEDLRAAAEALREWFGGVAVETYFALRRGLSLSFHQVDA